MNRLFLSLVIISAVVLLIGLTTIAEEITLITYYPAPYGEYGQLYVSGNVGIGTTNPGANLEVAGQVKITGGSPEAGKVLTSDANGLASWQTAGGIPSGVIVMWSGTLAKIPSGWALCDGAKGTPDLRDKFVYGVSTGENPGATGGSPSGTITLPFAWNRNYNSLFNIKGRYTPEGPRPDEYNWLTISGTWSDSRPAFPYLLQVGYDKIPPYYKLAYIMKL